MDKSSTQKRVGFIDEVRGFAILCMVLYHTFYDLVVIFSFNIPVFHSNLVQNLVTVFVGIFVFISGTSSAFSKNNLKRGLICFGLGLAMTLFTALFMPSQLIVFGILHMLGISMILYAVLTPLLKKIPPVALIAVSALLYIFTYHVSNGFVGLFGLFQIELPQSLYQFGYLFAFGFISPNFSSADYFSLLPWFFCFIAGSGFGRLIKEGKMPNFIYQSHCKPLAFVGRHTIIVYLLHQPIVYGILSLLMLFIHR